MESAVPPASIAANAGWLSTMSFVNSLSSSPLRLMFNVEE